MNENTLNTEPKASLFGLSLKEEYSNQQNLVFFAYSLSVISAGILLLVSAAPVFFLCALVAAGFFLLIIFYQVLSGPKGMRPHYRYCFRTFTGGILIALMTLAAFLASYWYGVPKNGQHLSAGQTRLFVSHAYLFWVFLPVFVYTALRAFRGWTNVKYARLALFRPPEKKEPLWRYGLVSLGISVLILMGSGLLTYFCESAATSILFLFAREAIKVEAFHAAGDLQEWLQASRLLLTAGVSVMFLLYRVLNALGLYSFSYKSYPHDE